MAQTFFDHFDLVLANTSPLREEVFRLRYRVYCQELHFEREEDCPGGLEQDIFDTRSIHCLLRHRFSGLYAGCVRLVLPDPLNPLAPFPFEQVYQCGENFPNIARASRREGQRFGEVSRLAVPAYFRKAHATTSLPASTPSLDSLTSAVEEDRSFFPLIALVLSLAATYVALEARLDSVFTMMEPRLARLLNRYGIYFSQIGNMVEYHGQRAPFQITYPDIINCLGGQTYEMLKLVRANLELSQLPALLYDLGQPQTRNNRGSSPIPLYATYRDQLTA